MMHHGIDAFGCEYVAPNGSVTLEALTYMLGQDVDVECDVQTQHLMRSTEQQARTSAVGQEAV